MSRSVPQLAVAAGFESALHALGLPARAAAAARPPALAACELVPLGFLVLRGAGNDPAFAAAVAAVAGAAPPVQPLSLTRCAAGVLVWISPDEWLLLCRHAARQGLHQALALALDGQHAQVVDNSSGLTALRFAGPDHEQLLRHLVPFDTRRLTVGRAVGTVMSKAQVTLLRTDEAGVIVLVRRSFADYVWRLAERAGRPYGFDAAESACQADPLVAPLLPAV